MGYETAPATVLLATVCACCARPLVDAVSVNTGMGPTCRKKHGFNQATDEATRALVNKLVYGIAADRSNNGVTVQSLLAVTEIRALGFSQLADILDSRLCDVRLVEDQGQIKIFAPYNEAALPAFRMLPGRKWDGEGKCNRIPATAQAKTALLGILRTYYPGMLAIGSKGPFTL